MKYLFILLVLISCNESNTSPKFKSGECIIPELHYNEFLEPNLSEVRKVLKVGQVNYLIMRLDWSNKRDTIEFERKFEVYDDSYENFITIKCPNRFR